MGAATWFPDSRRVLFIAAAPGEGERAYVQDIDGGQRKAVGPVGIGSPSSIARRPDDRRLVAERPGPLFADGTQWPTRVAAPSRMIGRFSGVLMGARCSSDGEADWLPRSSAVELATGRRTLVYEVSARDPAGAAGPSAAHHSGWEIVRVLFQRVLDDLFLVDGLK